MSFLRKGAPRPPNFLGSGFHYSSAKVLMPFTSESNKARWAFLGMVLPSTVQLFYVIARPWHESRLFVEVTCKYWK